jgi:DNA-binding transcriptional LysR family regulator
MHCIFSDRRLVQIRNLKDEVGVKLLMRTQSHVGLMAGGERFLEEARKVVKATGLAVEFSLYMVRAVREHARAAHAPDTELSELVTGACPHGCPQYQFGIF